MDTKFLLIIITIIILHYVKFILCSNDINMTVTVINYEYSLSTNYNEQTSYKEVTDANEVMSNKEVPLWSIIMDDAQLALTVIGVAANSVSLLTLLRNGNAFQPVVLYLLKHQSFIDMSTCLFGALLLTLPFMWQTGVRALDVFVCHAWHGQAIYWGTLWISTWNLLLIAFERYLAVCHPFKHQNFRLSKARLAVFFGYPLGILTSSGSYFQVTMDSIGNCISEFFFTGKFGEYFMMGYAIATFFLFWALPVFGFCIFYGLVVMAFRKRQKQSHLASSRVIDSATTELTRTAIVVTIIFAIALGYDLWYYLFGYIGVTEYKMNAPVQKIGVLFSVCNSVANPFVYTMLMPAYRKSLLKTFGCLGAQNKTPLGGSLSSLDKTSVSIVP